jgi:ParB family transcriptional regulator, chromosome partitioning protein
MTAKKTGLGRGLEALLGPTAARPMVVVGDRPSEPPAEELSHLPLDLLQRGAYQPRIDMRTESLTELAESIKAQGVVQPIIVRPLPRTAGSMRYEIIAGERRWRAAQLAGLSEIPALVRRVDDRTAIAMALIENIQRENLNPLEEARALDRLISEFSLTHQEAAAAVGRSRAAVSNLLRLLELSDEVKGLVERRELEMGHARALLPLESRRQQAEVALLVAKKSLSVRETEALVRRLQRPADGIDRAARASDADVSRLATELSEKLGAQVQLRHNASGRGQLIVRFTSLDELDGILAHIH